MGIRAVANYTGKRSCHRMPGGGFDSAAELITSFNGPKVWYDLSNIATLQQDSAGTIPVATAGDPIGRVMDISGANNHAIQATAASRPLWQTTYASFDGVDDSWATPSIDFTSTNKITVIMGVRKLSDASFGLVVELGNALPVGSFLMAAPFTAATGNFGASIRGTAAGFGAATASSFSAPITAVVTEQFNLSSTLLPPIRVNAVASGTGASSATGGVFGNYPLYVGRRGGATLPFTGNLYGLIIIGRLLSTAELRMLEQYMAQKAGISL